MHQLESVAAVDDLQRQPRVSDRASKKPNPSQYIFSAAGTDTIQVQRSDAGDFGSHTLLTVNQDLVAGDTLALLVVNATTLQLWRKTGGAWSQLGADITDSTYRAAGNLALACRGNVVRIDDLSLTNPGAAASAFVPRIINH